MLKVLDLRTLVGIAHVGEDRAGAGPAADHVLHVQIVVGVGRLEPRAAVVQVEVHRIGRR